jgi:hypothetical protein
MALPVFRNQPLVDFGSTRSTLFGTLLRVRDGKIALGGRTQSSLFLYRHGIS